jgi:uncharacterized protein DUF3500
VAARAMVGNKGAPGWMVGFFPIAYPLDFGCLWRMRCTQSALFLGILCFQHLTSTVLAHSPAEEMADGANNFLAALTPDQKAKAVFEFKDNERFDWHFIPKERKGLAFKDMTPPQRLLAHALLSSGLSQRGYMTATTIMSLEQILYDLENQAPSRDADLYFVTIFGQPGKASWGWRVEGHHLSLNFAIADDQVLSVTPSFFGANPAQILSGPRKGLRVLGGEEDLARKLVTSLNGEQRRSGIITNIAPRDIITGADRKAKALEPMGIVASELTKPQQELLFAVVKEYVLRYRAEIADADLKAIRESGLEKLHFGWAGGLEPGQGHYYRIQGPTFLMEYDNTQDHANHIHSVWRELQNDFGEDLLRKHYDQTPHAR